MFRLEPVVCQSQSHDLNCICQHVTGQNLCLMQTVRRCAAVDKNGEKSTTLQKICCGNDSESITDRKHFEEINLMGLPVLWLRGDPRGSARLGHTIRQPPYKMHTNYYSHDRFSCRSATLIFSAMFMGGTPARKGNSASKYDILAISSLITKNIWIVWFSTFSRANKIWNLLSIWGDRLY